MMPAIFEKARASSTSAVFISWPGRPRTQGRHLEGRARRKVRLPCAPRRSVPSTPLESGVSQAANNEGWLPTNRQTLQLEGFPNACAWMWVIRSTCRSPRPRLPPQTSARSSPTTSLRRPVPGCTVDVHDGKVQVVAQMGLEAGMPLVMIMTRTCIRPRRPVSAGCCAGLQPRHLLVRRARHHLNITKDMQPGEDITLNTSSSTQ